MTCTAIGSARRLSPRTASAADRTELRGVRGRDLSWRRDRSGQETRANRQQKRCLAGQPKRAPPRSQEQE